MRGLLIEFHRSLSIRRIWLLSLAALLTVLVLSAAKGSWSVASRSKASSGGVAFFPLRANSTPVQKKTSSIISAKPQLVLQQGHRYSVVSVAYSPDGTSFASAGNGGGVKLWNAKTWELKADLGSVSEPMAALTFSPDGKTLVGQSGYNAVLWDVQKAAVRRRLDFDLPASPKTLSFSPTGNILIRGRGGSSAMDLNSAVEFWDVSTGRRLRSLPLTACEIRAVALSPDGRLLAVGGKFFDSFNPDGIYKVQVWETQTGRLKSTLKTGGNELSAVAFSPDGKTLACDTVRGFFLSSREAAEVQIWNVQTARLQHRLPQPGRIDSLAFSPKSNKLACATLASGQAEINVWNFQTRKIEIGLKDLGTLSSPIAFAPDGKSLAFTALIDISKSPLLNAGARQNNGQRPASENSAVAWSGAGAIFFWDMQGAIPRALAGHSRPLMDVCPFGEQWLGVAAADDTETSDGIEIWNTRTGRLKGMLPGSAPMAISADGRKLASYGFASQLTKSNPVREPVDANQPVLLRDAETGKLIKTLPCVYLNTPTLRFSPDGKTLAAVAPTRGKDRFDESNYGLLTLWDVSTGKQRRQMRVSIYARTSPLAFAPNGKTLVSAGMDADENAVAQVWEVSTGKLRRTLRVRTNNLLFGGITGLAFSPDGTILAGRNDSSLVFWETTNWKQRKVLEGPAFEGGSSAEFAENAKTPVLFAPDRKTVAVESERFTVKFLDIASGKVVRETGVHGDVIRGLTSISGGKTLVSVSGDGSIKLWSTKTGRLRATLTILAAGRTSGGKVLTEWIATTPEGYYDASSGADRFIRWRVGAQLVPAGALRKKMHRPEMLKKSLQGS